MPPPPWPPVLAGDGVAGEGEGAAVVIDATGAATVGEIAGNGGVGDGEVPGGVVVSSRPAAGRVVGKVVVRERQRPVVINAAAIGVPAIGEGQTGDRRGHAGVDGKDRGTTPAIDGQSGGGSGELGAAGNV